MDNGQAEQLVVLALQKKNVELMGFHCHIGSQIFEPAPFCDATVLMLRFIAKIRDRHGCCAGYLNLGGGMAVPYVKEQLKINYTENIRLIGQTV